jgi:hypothetical protein
MAATPEHIQRIADFAFARVDEQLSGDNAERLWATDDVSRSLRALRRAVEQLRAKTGLAKKIGEPDLAVAATLTLSLAWQDLRGIAKEWNDHPDYLPEFGLFEHQLGDRP